MALYYTRHLPVPLVVDRVKLTGIASIASAGYAVIMIHTSNGESLSEILATAGTEKDAAVEMHNL